MKIFKILLLSLLGLIVLLIAIGFCLPGTYHVERTVAMKGRTADVFPLIGTLTRWPEWTVWNQEFDPSVKQEYSNPPSGTGAWFSWTGKKSGEGTLKITRADPEKGIAYDLDFEHGRYLSNGEIRLEPAGESMKVTWTNEGSLGLNPIARFFGLLMDKQMGPDFEKGLQNLKTRVESKPAQPAPGEAPK